MNNKFEIGQEVYWLTGQSNILSRGLVREEFENEVEVVCFEINGSPTKRKIKIKKQLLICEQ
jgi:hypothetical protein